MHQRSCRVILGLNNEFLKDIFEEECNNECQKVINESDTMSANCPDQEEEYPELRKGINLPDETQMPQLESHSKLLKGSFTMEHFTCLSIILLVLFPPEKASVHCRNGCNNPGETYNTLVLV